MADMDDDLFTPEEKAFMHTLAHPASGGLLRGGALIFFGPYAILWFLGLLTSNFVIAGYFLYLFLVALICVCVMRFKAVKQHELTYAVVQKLQIRCELLEGKSEG